MKRKLFLAAMGVSALCAAPMSFAQSLIKGKTDAGKAWAVQVTAPKGWTSQPGFAHDISVSGAIVLGDVSDGEPDQVLRLIVLPREQPTLDAALADYRKDHLANAPKDKSAPYHVDNKTMSCKAIKFETEAGIEVSAFCDPGAASSVYLQWAMIDGPDAGRQNRDLQAFEKVVASSVYKP
ncbi:hypothetical protein [Dyella sp.]|uniref:hypothetical protein n=1 Tax=Dyella sp. TaxID=1869338 RepID=UPI002ED564F4